LLHSNDFHGRQRDRVGRVRIGALRIAAQHELQCDVWRIPAARRDLADVAARGDLQLGGGTQAIAVVEVWQVLWRQAHHDIAARARRAADR